MIDKELKKMAVKAHDLPRFYYYMVPKLLFYGKYRELSNSARLLYSMIWDRLRIAQQSGWEDEEGFLFVRFARKTAAYILCINSKHTIQTCYEQLQQAKLIYRIRNGKTLVDNVYPLLPNDAEASKLAYDEMRRLEIEEQELFASNPFA